MKSQRTYSKSGFTLIEVIITLVVVAIVAAMMTAYFGTGITQSSIPIFRLSAAGKLNRIMEKITAEYDQIPRWSPATAYTNITSPASIVIPTPSRRQDPYGYQYICTVAGTSAAMPPTGLGEPSWPVPGITAGCTNNPPTYTGCTVTDGIVGSSVTWQLHAVAPLLLDLHNKIGVTEAQDYTVTFGVDSISYRVIQSRFIKFVGTAPNFSEAPVVPGDPNDYLKVTIGLSLTEPPPRTDETLTTLFVRR
jgi:prepilin-type N-terminal cleavage/methylation domain-containing protein